MKKILSLITYKTIAIFSIAVILVGSGFVYGTYFSEQRDLHRVLSYQDDDQSGLSEENPMLNEHDELGVGDNNYFESVPHSSCVIETQEVLPMSDIYNSNTDYNVSFVNAMSTSSSSPQNLFADVNGDSLPDYIYASHHTFSSTAGGTNYYESVFAGCVYLNNGAGWDKAYRCYAYTKVNRNTGDIMVAEYHGDCAGEPSAKADGTPKDGTSKTDAQE